MLSPGTELTHAGRDFLYDHTTPDCVVQQTEDVALTWIRRCASVPGGRQLIVDRQHGRQVLFSARELNRTPVRELHYEQPHCNT